LNAAEEALAQQAKDAKAELKLLEEKLSRLRADMDLLRKKQRKASDSLERRVATERRKYEAALARWRAS
jgi:hypothetical protein